MTLYINKRNYEPKALKMKNSLVYQFSIQPPENQIVTILNILIEISHSLAF